jgi:hypothetical protein
MLSRSGRRAKSGARRPRAERDSIRDVEAIPTEWSEAPWHAPLDATAAVEAIPDDAMISGMFISAVIDAARGGGMTLPSARERYVAFRKYPLREHAQILVEAARAIWPALGLREGLRKLGRGAPRALVSSMVGRVVLGSVEGPLEILGAMARSYPIHAQSCACGRSTTSSTRTTSACSRARCGTRR